MSKTQKLHTLIASGKYKGKKLLLPSLETTRSTKSIVKGCVFNVLRPHLRGTVFIEAFGGSGVMAAEALSNGATKAYAIELDKKAYEITLQNATIDKEFYVIKGDSFELLPQLLMQLSREKNLKLILYFDPPFDVREGFLGIYEKIFTLLQNLNLNQTQCIVLEYRSGLKLPQNLSHLTLFKIKKFGQSSLAFYKEKSQSSYL